MVLAVEGGAFLIYGLWYGGVWLAKYVRDQDIARKSLIEPTNEATVLPPRTSPGSSRLFVPPPLDRP